MRYFLFIILLVTPVFAQEPSPEPVAPAAQGPSVPLPDHSKPIPIDLTKLQQRAIDLSDRIREPATSLFSFLALLALVWAGFQAQFRGLHEFITPLLMIIVCSALIVNYKEIIPVVLDARNELKNLLLEDDFVFTKQLSSLMASLGTSVTLMSFSGVASGICLFLILIASFLLFIMQLLFESVLISLGPLAIASLAFSVTRGIFTFWFKTWIAVLLIPVGWILGAKFVGETFLITEPDTMSFLVSVVSILGYGAVFLGMPVLTLMIVNSAGGVAGSAMPSFLAVVSSMLSNFSSFGSGGLSAGNSSSLPQGTVPLLQIASESLSTPATSTPQAMGTSAGDTVSSRVGYAQKWHNIMKFNKPKQ